MRYLMFSWVTWRAIIFLAAVLTLPGQCQQSTQAARNRSDTCLNAVEDPSNIATQ